MARYPIYKPNLDLEDELNRSDIESKALFFMETIREMLDSDEPYAAYQSVYKTEIQPLAADSADAALARKAWASLFTAHIVPGDGDSELLVHIVDRLQLLDPNEASPFQWGISTKVAGSVESSSMFVIKGDDSVKTLNDLSPQIAAQVWLLERGVNMPHAALPALSAVAARREERKAQRAAALANALASDPSVDTNARV